MSYLLAGMLALWALTFAYLAVLGRRQRRLERDLELLREERDPERRL